MTADDLDLTGLDDILDELAPIPPPPPVARPGWHFIEGIEVPARCPLCRATVIYERQSKVVLRVRCAKYGRESGSFNICHYRQEFPR